MPPPLLAFSSTRSVLLAVLVGLCVCVSSCKKQDGGAAAKGGIDSPSPGYTLLHTLASASTELIDLDGRVVHSWASNYKLGGGAFIQSNGNLLRCGLVERNPFSSNCPGLSGAVEILDWDGNQIWSYELATPEKSFHHDITPLPNGNVLLLAVERKTKAELIEAGRDPARMRGEEMWFDYIVELKPVGKKDAEVVWEWHMWDHLIQDFDAKKKHFGVVADHPEKLDINSIEENIAGRSDGTLQRLQSLGYVGGGGGRHGPGSSLPDWSHANSITHHPELDQILISLRSSGEIWIIDHSTTKSEAATHTGGKRGKGGGLLYRWGNPQNYQRGTPKDQKLFGQHDAQWIASGLPGAGNILIFNNGDGRPDGAYSSVEEITPPLQPDGSYKIDDAPYGPDNVVWRYTAENKQDFYSSFLSGVQRLPNGHTLICSGTTADIFEVTASGKTVWKRNLNSSERNANRGPGQSNDGPPQSGSSPVVAPAGDHGLTSQEIEFLLGPQSLFGSPPPMAGGPGGPGGGPGGPGGGPGGPGGGPGGPGGGGPGGPGSTKGLFRAVRYVPDHPAFKGKKLVPVTAASQ